MATRIYVIPVSNPSRAGAAMVRHKRIPHRVVTLMPGLHPLLVRLAGFERHTVPALEVDGVQVQGSCRIARFLDELAPDPPLYPSDPAARARVEEAEHWGERALQPVPRRLFRHRGPAGAARPGGRADRGGHDRRRRAERGGLPDPVERARAARVRGAP